LSIPGSDVRQPSWGPFMDWVLGRYEPSLNCI
jgi:hypothetical protein